MAVLTVQQVALTGLATTYAAAGVAGDSFINDGRTFAHVKNGSGVSVTVTVDSQQFCNHGYDHNETVVIPAGTERMIGPLPTQRWNDTNGRANLTYSAVTTVTVAAIRP